MTSCAKHIRQKLHATADQINKELPMDLGQRNQHGPSLSYDTDDNTIVFHYSISEEIQTIKNLRNAAKHSADSCRTIFRASRAMNLPSSLPMPMPTSAWNTPAVRAATKSASTSIQTKSKSFRTNRKAKSTTAPALPTLSLSAMPQCPHADGWRQPEVMTGVALRRCHTSIQLHLQPRGCTTSPRRYRRPQGYPRARTSGRAKLPETRHSSN